MGAACFLPDDTHFLTVPGGGSLITAQILVLAVLLQPSDGFAATPVDQELKFWLSST